jgi:hypothetical protein
MNTNSEALPLVETAPAASFIPEKLAEHTEAFGHAMMDLITTPVAGVGKPEVFNQRLDEVSHSLDLIYQNANSSMQTLNIAAEEAFRRQYELGLHLMQDLAVVKSPAEAFHLQFNFLAAQAELFMEQSKEMQRQFTSMFSAHKPGARANGPENRGDK